MNRDAQRAANKIRQLYTELKMCGLPVSEKFGPSGLADDEIDRLALSQGVDEVPAAIREILRLIGLFPGRFGRLGAFGRDAMNQYTKEAALESLSWWSGGGDRMADPDGMLIFFADEVQYFVAVDRTMLHQPDPELWGITEGGESNRLPSVTKFFESLCGGIKDKLADQR